MREKCARNWGKIVAANFVRNAIIIGNTIITQIFLRLLSAKLSTTVIISIVINCIFGTIILIKKTNQLLLLFLSFLGSILIHSRPYPVQSNVIINFNHRSSLEKLLSFLSLCQRLSQAKFLVILAY